MNRRNLALSVAAVVAVCLTGCSAGGKKQASMGMLSPEHNVISLAAGDSLGRSIYVNDMILAAAAIEQGAMFTNVDGGAVELLLEH